jgi:hypothetical protein
MSTEPPLNFNSGRGNPDDHDHIVSGRHVYGGVSEDLTVTCRDVLKAASPRWPQLARLRSSVSRLCWRGGGAA